MNQNQRPVEKEYRSSQMYKTLTGAGIPAADKLAWARLRRGWTTR